MAANANKLRAALRKKVGSSNRKFLRVGTLLLYIAFAGLVFVSIGLALLAGMADVSYGLVDVSAEQLRMEFGKDADFGVRFVPDEEVDEGRARVVMKKNVNFVCQSSNPADGVFSFWIKGGNGTVVDSGPHPYPCEVQVRYNPSGSPFQDVVITGDDHRHVEVLNDIPDEDDDKYASLVDGTYSPLRIKKLSVSGTFVEADVVALTVEDTLAVSTLIGDIYLRNVSLGDGLTGSISTGKGNLLVESRSPFETSFAQSREHVCAQGISQINTFTCDPGMMFDTCRGMNATAAALLPGGNATLARQCRSGCSRGSVSVGAITALSPRLTLSAAEGGLSVRHVPFGRNTMNLASPWHGFGGPKPINFTSADYKILSEALHGDKEYDMLNVFISGPGAPEGIYLWGRRDIYLKIHPPVLNMASAGLLNPITLEVHATLSPTFCPAVMWDPDIFITDAVSGTRKRGNIGVGTDAASEGVMMMENMMATTSFKKKMHGNTNANANANDNNINDVIDHSRGILAPLDSTDVEKVQSPDLFERKVAVWKLLLATTKAPDNTRFAIREGCIGNYIFEEDPRSGRVSKVVFTWLNDPTVVAVGAISIGLSIVIGIVVAIVVKKVYRTQVKNKRQELLVRLRSLKSQGYYPLGGGYFVYHSPPDKSRWKRDFYIGDPFGRILALRSMRETPKTFVDVFRALNGQSYQTVRIQFEDESAVKRARRRRRDKELSSSLALTQWYRGLKLQRGLEEKAARLREDIDLAVRRAEVQKNVKRARLGVLDGLVQGAPSSLGGGGGGAGAGSVSDAARAIAVAAAVSAAGLSAVPGQVRTGEDAVNRYDDENDDEEKARIEADAQKQKREEELAAAEKREDTERREQSKLEARAKKAEMAEEERLVAFFVGPFMFMEIFVETLAYALIPGLATRRDFDKDAIATIKKLLKTPTRQNIILSLGKAFRISDANMRQRAIDYVKANGRDHQDTINRLIREYQAKRGAGNAFARFFSWIGREKASQVIVVTAHIIVLLLPPLLLIIFGFMLVATWSSSPITAKCFTGGVTALPIFLVGFLFYFLAYSKLILYYLEVDNRLRLRIRRIFHIYTGFLIAASVSLIMIIVFWVLLGLLLNPEKAAAPATAIGTMVSFVLAQYRRLKEIRDTLRKGIEDFIEEKFSSYTKHIENLDDVIDRVISEFGFSLRNVVVALFAAASTLGCIFAFIFLGIAVFEGKGAAMAMIQSAITVIAGAGYSFLKGKEGSEVKDKIKVKVPGLLRDLLQSILEKGMDMAKSINKGGAFGAAGAAAGGGGKSEPDQDVEVTATLYGAIKLVERQGTVQGAVDFPLLKVSTIVPHTNERAIKPFWTQTSAADAMDAGLASARTIQSSRSEASNHDD